MKRIVIYLLLILPFAVRAQDEKGINFDRQLSWAQIKAKAKAESKYIFVDVFATWCGPCKMMDRDVYADNAVAALMNDKFISVKLQMDSTKNDDYHVKSWYAEARNMKSEFRFGGYPSYLFFSPSGQMILQDIGYKKIIDFMAMASQSLDPKRLKYSALLEDYKNGKKEYGTLGTLALFTRNVVKDRELAMTIAIDYKTNYLGNLSDQELSTKKIVDFFATYYLLININDNFFKLCYNSPDKVDEIFGQKGWANAQVAGAISRGELDNKLLKDGKPAVNDPNFQQLFAFIESKYAKINLKKPLLDYRIAYYRKQESWERWADAKNVELQKYPPVNDFYVYVNFNVFGAWDAFLHCPDKKVLREALKWSDQALSLIPDTISMHTAILDTKANLLYKLNKRKDAINLEKKAVDKDPKDKENFEHYQKMLKGEPTWPSND